MFINKFREKLKSVIKNKKVEETIYSSEKEHKKEDTIQLSYIGIINASTPKYKSILDTIHILEKNEFKLLRIRTDGVCSGHDCTDNFSNEYSSYEDFISKVYDDFNSKKERVAGFAQLDWSITMFELLNEEHNIRIILGIDEGNGNTNSCEAYLSIHEQSDTPETYEFIKNLITKLNIINVHEL